MPAWWDYARLVGFFYSGCSNGTFQQAWTTSGVFVPLVIDDTRIEWAERLSVV